MNKKLLARIIHFQNIEIRKKIYFSKNNSLSIVKIIYLLIMNQGVHVLKVVYELSNEYKCQQQTLHHISFNHIY